MIRPRRVITSENDKKRRARKRERERERWEEGFLDRFRIPFLETRAPYRRIEIAKLS